MVSGVGAVLRSGFDLLLPSSCLGCATAGVALCRGCAASTGPPRPHRPDPTPPGYPQTWVAGSYSGPLRAAVLAYKERGRTDLRTALAERLALAVAGAAAGSLADRLLLVPVPSTRAAVRRRGTDHMRQLVRRTAVVLSAVGWSAQPAELLRLVRNPRDSAGLGAAQRAANLAGAFTADGLDRLPAGALMVVVDDVVTTGTTLTQAALALRRAGGPVLAAAVAGTQRRHPRPISAR